MRLEKKRVFHYHHHHHHPIACVCFSCRFVTVKKISADTDSAAEVNSLIASAVTLNNISARQYTYYDNYASHCKYNNIVGTF